MGFVPVHAVGPSLSLGAGVRVVFLTLGARATMTHFSDSSVASATDFGMRGL